MGTVHAKTMPPQAPPEGADMMRPPPAPTHEKEIILADVPAKVQKVFIDGLGRTKDDIVMKQVKNVFNATNFEEMVFEAQHAKSRMEQLGLFKNIRIIIDVCKGDGARPDGYEVTYNVKESRRVTGGISTLVGTNEGSLLFTMKLPNMLGRAENITTEYTYGTKNTVGLKIQYTKPLNGNPDIRFISSVYQQSGEYPWSSYKQTDRGGSAEIMFPSVLGKHDIRYEGAWRELNCLTRTTAFAVREQSGHTFKSSVKHVFLRDTRDSNVFPSQGAMMKVSQEFAGLGGDAHFHKHDIEMQVNKKLLLDTVLQISVAGGCVRPLSPERPLHISDRFFIGGPLTLRGFNLNGCGPHEEGSALGANTYWLCGLHFYTPLPFRPGQGGFGDLFRTHFFLNMGNLMNMDFTNDPRANMHKLTDTLRMAYGAGIVFKLGGIARLELNYTVPVKVQKGDSINPGLQFGVGVSFL